MEKVINRIKKYSEARKPLSFTRMKKDGDTLLIYLDKLPYLEAGDFITFEKTIKDSTVNQYNTIIRSYRIDDVNEAEKKISIPFPYRDTLMIEKISMYDDGKYVKIDFNKEHNIVQDDIESNPYLKLDIIKGDRRIRISNLSMYDEYLEECRKNGIIVFDDAVPGDSILCSAFPKDAMTLAGNECRFTGSDFIIEEQGECATSNNSVELYYIDGTISFPIPSYNSMGSDINKEELFEKYFVNEVIEGSIPEIIDMEKVCFEPYVLNNNKLKQVNKIIINPHFRKRILDGWNTDDGMFWNCSDCDGNISDEDYGRADSLLDMNFSEDDIKYGKNKLKMSFLRLSFYDRPNPFDQQLLYYSTVFFNYGKSMKDLIDLKKEKNVSEDRMKKALTSEFRITSKYDSTNSSEGFYFYLFNDTLNESKTKTIYLKIEFNHAGVGKTIPLMWCGGEKPPKNFILKNNDGEEDANVNRFFRSLYIPIGIKYSEELGKYIYTVLGKNLYNSDDDSITLNVFEPKLN